MGGTIIVFTGPFRGRRLIAEKIARWLEAPCLFMESILEGLLPCNISDSTLVRSESVFEELLQPLGHVSTHRHPVDRAYKEEEAKNQARTALRLVLSQLPHLARTMNSTNSCIVLELPWCSSEVVRMLMTIMDHHPNKTPFDRGLIIECQSRGESSTDKWRQFEKSKIYPGTFSSGRHDGAYYNWADIEKAVEQQLFQMSSKFDEQVEMLHSEGVKDRLVIRLEMDPSFDIDFGFDPRREREESETVPSAFHKAVYNLAFLNIINCGTSISISMRKWDDFLRKHFYRDRITSTPCFNGQTHHTMSISDDQSLLVDDRRCRLCREEVIIPKNDFSSSYYYYCLRCPLNLHKACAESLNNSSVKLPSPAAIAAYDEWIKLMEQEDKLRTVTCLSCKAKGERFSRRCCACLFDTFLKSSLLPMVVPYPFFIDEQLDFFVSRTVRKGNVVDEPCAACGEPIQTTAGIYYIYPANSLCYGFSCVALLPRETLHTHFGHRHVLKLMDKPHQILDDCICHVCLEERDPTYWYYYCEECEYTAHLYCIADDIPRRSRYH